MEPGSWAGYANRSAAHSPLVRGAILESIEKQFAATRQVRHVLLKKLRPSKAEKQSKAKPARALQHGGSRAGCQATASNILHLGLGLLLPRMQASVLSTVCKSARQMMGSGETS